MIQFLTFIIVLIATLFLGRLPKNKPIRILVWLVGSLVLLVLAVGILFGMFGNQAVRSGIEKAGTYVLKVPVTLEDADLSILGGTLELQNLQIANPEGYNHPQFLTMGKGFTALNTSSLFSDTIQIEKIQLDQVELVIEQKGLTNNLQQILKALPKSEDKPAEEKAGKDLLIKELVINEVSVKAKLLPVPGQADTLTLNLAPIRMTDLGTGQKLDVAGLISKMIMAIAAGVAEQGKGILPVDMVGPLTDQLTQQGQQILQEGQKLLEGTGEGILDTGKDVGEQATDALKGLFQKKEKE